MQTRHLSYILITALGAVFFIPFIGSSHLFDWDEINFAESAREMILTGNYATVQINYMPFWEKPPLFFWMQVLAMKAFNVLIQILDLHLNLVLAFLMLSLVSLPFWCFIESDENSIMKSLVCCGLWDI
jgi:4-amino-4-deoxy-L-arabinose transferase-like glycosyltransferase